MKIPTVKIEAPGGGFMIINESDFDEDAHVLFGDESPAEIEPEETEDAADEPEEIEDELPGDVAEPGSEN